MFVYCDKTRQCTGLVKYLLIKVLAYEVSAGLNRGFAGLPALESRRNILYKQLVRLIWCATITAPGSAGIAVYSHFVRLFDVFRVLELPPRKEADRHTSRQPTADSPQPTANSQQPTANSQQIPTVYLVFF
jgi:hypothetical protein